jgi:nucleoside phosphorylase
MSPVPPTLPSDFSVCIICALPLEARAVSRVLEDFRENIEYSRGGNTSSRGDDNIYSTGKLGSHKVLLTYMPGMGTVSAAAVAAALNHSFKGIKLAQLVGICGGVPGEKVRLGDVIIGTHVVSYGFGRQYPDQFARKSDSKDTPRRPGPGIRDETRIRQRAPCKQNR